MFMDDSSNPFRSAGLALLIAGLMDVAVMVYCIVNKISYSSSFNIFAVIAGIFLLRKGVKTARTVRWLSAFMIAGFIGVMLTMPLTMPLGLMKAYLSVNTAAAVGAVLFGILLIAFLVWFQRQLSTPASLSLLGEAGYETGKPKSAYMAGVALVVVLIGFFMALAGGESGQKAIQLAQQELGTEFDYHVSSMTVSGSSGWAVVTAYNDSEIQNIEVTW